MCSQISAKLRPALGCFVPLFLLSVYSHFGIHSALLDAMYVCGTYLVVRICHLVRKGLSISPSNVTDFLGYFSAEHPQILPVC